MSSATNPGRSRQLHLGLNMVYGGTHFAAWRAPYADPLGAYSVEQWVRAVRLAEQAKFDFAFSGDLLSLATPLELTPPMGFDPAVLLSVLVRETSRIGLVGTASTSFEEPFHIARRFASLDHLSQGRAGWNVVTTFDPNAAANFGKAAFLEREQRYARADEFVEVVRALWDSWEDGAVLADQVGGVFADSARVHPINHHGRWFDVAGPLTIPRPPQGRPVLVQAGGSAGGVRLAARHADLVFCSLLSLDHAGAFAEDVRRELAAQGRPRDAIRILPGLGLTLGGTEAEARQRLQDLDEKLGGTQIFWLAALVGAEPADFDLDKPLPKAILAGEGRPVPMEGMRNALLGLGREGFTVREILQRFNTSHRQITGTPEQVAEDIELWFRSGAVDGFNIMADELLTGLTDFVEQVLPILRRRGLFREEYSGSTLREHLGLERPAN
jgi:FMN-dependent oxidoreductase (nitrilotriacetate monooxygenase family)